ncbi:MAG: hypothetical protein RID53_03400 [Coleofasciculus sp. B1-GNL1-01]|uniref:hypothetical protein n=1 Tax=Coleofasciculus sp. B1-GNL1-01 TaxID=3068484 RepID=UPI0032FD8F09
MKLNKSFLFKAILILAIVVFSLKAPLSSSLNSSFITTNNVLNKTINLSLNYAYFEFNDNSPNTDLFGDELDQDKKNETTDPISFWMGLAMASVAFGFAFLILIAGLGFIFQWDENVMAIILSFIGGTTFFIAFVFMGIALIYSAFE